MRWARRLPILFAALLLLPVGIALVFRVAAAFRETDTAVPVGTSLVPTRLGTVAARIEGDHARPAILLVHGTAAWSGFWRDVSRHLRERGWRVIAVDLPPFGYSGRDPGGRYDRVSQAERLAVLLRRTGAGPTVVLGHSFGAGAATELAVRHPEQVRRLVLVDAALGPLDPGPGKSAPERLLALGPVAQGVTAASVTNPLATGALLRSFMSRKAPAARWVETIQQPMRRTGTTAAYAAWLPALFETDDGALSRRRAALAAIKPPVAIIWGETDTVTPLAQGQALAGITRARRFTVLKAVGHIPHVEAPREFTAALDQILADGG